MTSCLKPKTNNNQRLTTLRTLPEAACGDPTLLACHAASPWTCIKSMRFHDTMQRITRPGLSPPHVSCALQAALSQIAFIENQSIFLRCVSRQLFVNLAESQSRSVLHCGLCPCLCLFYCLLYKVFTSIGIIYHHISNVSLCRVKAQGLNRFSRRVCSTAAAECAPGSFLHQGGILSANREFHSRNG